ASGGNGASGATGSAGVGGGPPIFETDIVPLLQKSCGAGDNACHARVAYGASKNADCRGWLTLEDAPLGAQYYGGDLDGQPTGCPDLPLYERLVQLDAWQQCGSLRKKYIVPCDVDASYLFDKVDDGPYCEDSPGGKPSLPMPKAVEMDAGEREILRAWILAGTPRLSGGTVDCGGGAGGAGGGQVGQAPSASISHPGDGETRKVGVPIPFIGAGTDPEDGDIPGASLVWESSLDGLLGTGASFDAALTTVGTHVVTLTATDSDGNLGSDSLTLNMEP
ncbi:MAG: hypothetical protein WKG00_05080, partial [Polyangiaceae bacterium]